MKFKISYLYKKERERERERKKRPAAGAGVGGQRPPQEKYFIDYSIKNQKCKNKMLCTNELCAFNVMKKNVMHE